MEKLTIKVYGSGCKGCQTLHQNVIDALAEMNIAADVQYITDMQKIMEIGVMSLPALAVNDKIMSAGKVLSVADVKNIWGKKMTHKEKAVNYFSQKLHCSQSVLAAFAKECSITEEEAFKLGSCFGSGMRKGEVCGAVTGALMVLGLLYGQKAAGDTEGRQVSNKVNDLMMDRFKEKCGSYICNDLLGCDVSTAEGVQYCRDNKLFTDFCPKMVAAAVEVVEEIIKEQKKA